MTGADSEGRLLMSAGASSDVWGAVRKSLIAVLIVTVGATVAVGVQAPASGSEILPSDAPGCPLETGTILNANQTDWGSGFLRSDRGVEDATIGPISVSLVEEDYDIVLVSYDDHSIVYDQPQERWYVEVLSGNDTIYVSQAISDLPDDQDLLVEQVATKVRFGPATSIVLRHAAYSDETSPNSLFALCVSFVRGAFIDDDTSIFESDIEWMFSNGYTKGCNPPDNNRYCPERLVTRGQMAAFLSRVLGLTERADDPFTDDNASIFEADIERLYAAGITKGCNPPDNSRFCPEDRVTRGQMAALLSRAVGLLERADNPFTDDDGSVFEADIERIAFEAITRGCNPPDNDRYCPDRFVTRGEMAAFLRRAFG